MAKYKITGRRGNPAQSAQGSHSAAPPQVPETANVTDASQAAAFALYEEFFGKPAANEKPAAAAEESAPQDLFEPMPVSKDEFASSAAQEQSEPEKVPDELPVYEFGREEPPKDDVLDDQISIDELSGEAAEHLQTAAEVQSFLSGVISDSTPEENDTLISHTEFVPVEPAIRSENASPAPDDSPDNAAPAAEETVPEQTAPAAEETAQNDAPAVEDAVPEEAAPAMEHPDLIDPESVEPTREFSVEEVRKAVLEVPEPQAEQSETAAASAPDMSALFADMFGTGKPATKRGEKKRSASAARREETEEPTVTRSSIEDLVADPAGVTVPESDAGKPLDEAEPADADDEFTAPEQADGILERFRLTLSSLRREIVGLAILFLLSFYLESACFSSVLPLPHPEFLTPGKYGLVFLLVDLQLVLLAAVFGRRQFANGASGLFSGKANADGVPFTATIVSIIELAYLIGFARTQTGYLLFSCITVFLFLLAAIRDVLEIRADMAALGVLIDSKQLFAVSRLPENSPEVGEFEEYLNGGEPEAFSIDRTAFVDGFMERVHRRAPGGAMFAVGIPLVFLFAVGIAVWSYLGGRDATKAFSAFAAAAMMGLPACSLFAFTVPFYCAQKRARKHATALIGQNSVEECGGAEILSFDDTEVFLPKHVKVTSVRTYGAARIDKILIYCAQIFNAVGGPLSYVFQNSISSLENALHAPIEILENEGNGICAKIEGREIYLGGAEYLESYEFPVQIDASDKTYENTVGRIMYLAIDNELSAKFYIKYAVSARFEQQLRALNRAGVFAVVRTCDPNIDRALLEKILRTGGNPIGVLKTGEAAQNAPAKERVSAPIVSGGKRSGILNAFLLCDGVRARSAANTLVKFVSMLLGLVIAFALTYMTGMINPLVCLLYQALWIVPVVVPSLFDWPSIPVGKTRK